MDFLKESYCITRRIIVLVMLFCVASYAIPASGEESEGQDIELDASLTSQVDALWYRMPMDCGASPNCNLVDHQRA